MAKSNFFKVSDLLEEFKVALKRDEISFLLADGESASAHVKVLQDIEDLSPLVAKKEVSQDANCSTQEVDSFKLHEKGAALWRDLISAALFHIDRRAKGNSALYGYMKASTKFEDVLYGLEPYYRDHTLHSLWVYLIGLHLMNDGKKLKPVAEKLNWYLFNDIDSEEHSKFVGQWASLTEKYLNYKINLHRDAAWCVMALCHDLGYSIAKLTNLNERVLEVLKYYEVSDVSRVGYSLNIEHQFLVEQFLELMAMDVRIVPRGDDPSELDTNRLTSSGEDKKKKDALKQIEDWIENQQQKKPSEVFDGERTLYERLLDSSNEDGDSENGFVETFSRVLNNSTLVKCYRDDSAYWRLCKGLEKKEHGILSAYLLFKTLGIFSDSYIRGSAEEWGLEDNEVIYNIIRGDILFAIAQHEFDFAHVSGIGSLAELLILSDELEEFARYGRPMASREYKATMAETAVSFKYEDSEDESDVRWICIKMEYKSLREDDQEFLYAFRRKAKRLCELFTLENDEDRKKDKKQDRTRYPIKTIESTFTQKKGDHPHPAVTFTMSNDGTHVITMEAGVIELECRDDMLFCIAGDIDDDDKGKELTKEKLVKIVRKILEPPTEQQIKVTDVK